MTGAAVVVRQNKLMRCFENAGALNEGSARALEELGIRNSWIFRGMLNRGVFLEAAPGTYYMSLQNAGEFVQRRKVRVFTVTAILLLVFIIVMYLSNR